MRWASSQEAGRQASTSIGGAEGEPEAANHEPGQVVQV